MLTSTTPLHFSILLIRGATLPAMKPLAPTLRRLRRRQGLTHVDLARGARISRSFLSELETGPKAEGE
jgi:Helix-turn-helix domain